MEKKEYTSGSSTSKQHFEWKERRTFFLTFPWEVVVSLLLSFLFHPLGQLYPMNTILRISKFLGLFVLPAIAFKNSYIYTLGVRV